MILIERIKKLFQRKKKINEGYYWSSSLNSGVVDSAWDLFFSASSGGFSIRGVFGV